MRKTQRFSPFGLVNLRKIYLSQSTRNVNALSRTVSSANDAPMNLTGALEEWVSVMTAARRSTRTINERLLVINALARTCDPLRCDWRDIAAYLGNPSWQRATVRTYFDALASWFRWLVVVGYRRDNPILALPRPSSKRGLPRPISTAQLATILQTVNRHRTRTMIILAAYQGLRVHEIAKVRGEHVRNGRIRVFGKGDTDIDMPLHDLVKYEAQFYPRIGFWFPSYDDHTAAVTAKNVSRVISDTMHRAGVDASAHQLRHWTATEMLEGGAAIETVAEVLRHANLSNVMIYTKVNDVKRRAAVDSLPVPLRLVR